ncbi:MAG: glucokinase [Candidatus Binatia bacterium]
MAKRVLAGDIGGTKTNLALYEVAGGRELRPLREQSFPSREYRGLEDVLAEFEKEDTERIAAAAFGIAGPIVDGKVTTTNLPWRVERESLSRVLGTAHVRLMNDLETTAYGALFLPADKIHVLHEGKARRGNAAVIAAGTGLGQAFLYWDGARHHPMGTEGGHADFAPRDEIEIGLLRFLRKHYSRVSYERVLSGPGLYNIFRYLTEDLGKRIDPDVAERLRIEGDDSAVIGEAGVSGHCRTCEEAVDLFVSVYGAQAGNLALAGLAVAGVYVGGGIVTKLLPKVTSGRFMDSFISKGRYVEMMSEIPVRIILDPKTSLLGAAQAACDLC